MRETTNRKTQRSPLAMVVLSMLLEAPMHAYRMHELIKRRGKDTVVNVAQRNSVYQTIARLQSAGLIEIRETLRQEGRPERVVYAITDSGKETVRQWLTRMLAEPSREFPEFPAALATIMVLSPHVVRTQLERRFETLKQQLAEATSATSDLMERGLPRICLLEDEYKQTILKAEIKWLRALIDDLRGGELTWSKEWLRRIAASFEGGA